MDPSLSIFKISSYIKNKVRQAAAIVQYVIDTAKVSIHSKLFRDATVTNIEDLAGAQPEIIAKSPDSLILREIVWEMRSLVMYLVYKVVVLKALDAREFRDGLHYQVPQIIFSRFMLYNLLLRRNLGLTSDDPFTSLCPYEMFTSQLFK
jgi:hypothetical protein